MTNNTKYVQSLTQYLAGAGVIIGTTSVTFPSFTDIYGNNLTMSDFGLEGYGTLEPDTTNEEGFTFSSLVVNANSTVTLGGVKSILAKSPYTETSGLVRAHTGGTKVVITDNVAFWNTFTNKHNDETIDGQWTFTTFPITPSNSNASSTVIGVTKLSVDPVSPTNPIAVGDNDPRLNVTGVPTGTLLPYAGRTTAPTGFLFPDGTAISRTTYAALLAIVAPSLTFTVTIASPAVFTASGTHGLVVGDKVSLTTTGGLPSGLATNTDYYVIATGLTATAFEVALSPGGAAINTSGSQSGVHTYYITNFGKGDGSTTFNLPNTANKFLLGMGASTNITLPVEAANVSTGSDTFTVPDSTFPLQGQAVTLTSTGTLPAGLSLATTYYIVRASSTTVKFSTTQANANAATPVIVDITTQGSGVHNIIYALSAHLVIGLLSGEETHGLSVSELAGHTHSLNNVISTGGSQPLSQAANTALNYTATGSAGGDTLHNNMPPSMAINYIIKT